MDKYLTIEEAAKILRVCEETTRRWARTGKIPASKVGRKWLIQEIDIPTCKRKEDHETA